MVEYQIKIFEPKWLRMKIPALVDVKIEKRNKTTTRVYVSLIDTSLTVKNWRLIKKGV